MTKYSRLRETLSLNTNKVKLEDDLAYLTHFLQNQENGAKTYFEEEALNYIEDSGFQYRLPIEYDVPFPPPAHPKFKFIDLFAGIGGFRMAFQNLEGKCVFTSEWNKFSKKTYQTIAPKIFAKYTSGTQLNALNNNKVLKYHGDPSDNFKLSLGATADLGNQAFIEANIIPMGLSLFHKHFHTTIYY